MVHLTHVHFKRGSRPYEVTAMWLVSLILLAWAGWYFIIKLESQLVNTNSSIIQNVATRDRFTGPVVIAPKIESQTPVAPTAGFAPFLDIVPSQDGTDLFIKAGGVGQVGGTVMANIGIGPGNPKGGHTMTFSNTIQSYIATASGFTPGMSTFAPLNITTTTGLDTGIVDFNCAYIPAETTPSISSIDGNLQLTLVSTDTFPSEAYLVVVPSFAPPTEPPSGHRLVGSVYSVRASGAIVEADRPMSLRLAYDETSLAGADPHTVAIFGWEAFNQRWDELEGTLFGFQQYVSVPTSRFTTYALMATPTWRDGFDDLSGTGIAQFNNITYGGTSGQRSLILLNTPGSGSVVSQPITPTLPIAAWGTLTFSGIVTPPTTSLSVDILSSTGSVLMTNVSSGASLAGLDPAQYPALRLRVNMASTVAGQTPALDEWQVSWQAEKQKVYLPVLLKP